MAIRTQVNDTMYKIALATKKHIAVIETIARQYPNELAFVRRNAIERGIDNRSLHIALDGNGDVVGFVLFHRRRDGVQTVYDMAVHKDFKRQGIGRMLLHSVPCPIRLKTTEDNVSAQEFYSSCGMKQIATHQGKKRKLLEYEMKTLVVFCAGNNKRHPRVAYDAGMAYGVAQNDKPYAQPFMFDVEFVPEKQDWQDFMHKVHLYKPVMTVITDYMHQSERKRLYKQIRDVKRAGVLRVVCVPKFDGAIAHIPKFCIIGLSVPAKSEKFAGWLPQWREMVHINRRSVHILEGSPARQTAEIDRVKLYGGRVISVDGNSIQRASSLGSTWRNGRWSRPSGGEWEHGDYQNTLEFNAREYQKYINNPDDWLRMGDDSQSKRRIQMRQLKLL